MKLCLGVTTNRLLLPPAVYYVCVVQRPEEALP